MTINILSLFVTYSKSFVKLESLNLAKMFDNLDGAF